MAEDNQYVRLTTPRGVTVYPRLNKADTGPKKNPHPPQYKTKLIFPSDSKFLLGKEELSRAEIQTKLEEMRDELFEETKVSLKKQKKGDALKKLSKRDVFSTAVDDEGNDTDDFVLSCKMYAESKDKKSGEVRKRKPPIFNAKGIVMKNPPQIGGGSEVKLALSAKAYVNNTNWEVGVTFYLESAQLLKLVEYSGVSADRYGFGKEDGYDGGDDASDSSSPYKDETKDAVGSDAESSEENDDF